MTEHRPNFSTEEPFPPYDAAEQNNCDNEKRQRSFLVTVSQATMTRLNVMKATLGLTSTELIQHFLDLADDVSAK